MEEKRYPTIEDEGVIKAGEPIVAPVPDSVYANGVVDVYDEADDEVWDRIPSMGPFSDEEAIARIDRFEEEMAKGEVNWISSEEAWAQLYEKYPWLR